MAFVPLTPQSMNITIVPTLAQAYNSAPVLQLSGTAANLSAWVSLTAQIMPPAANPTGAAVTFGTVTAASTGVITLETSATDLDTVSPGQATLLISGKPTSGDIAQLLATGVVTISNYP